MPIKHQVWPVLTHYDQQHLARIALPLGGIGTGTLSLGGRGDLRDWELVNRPAKGFKPRNTFFALFTRNQKGDVAARALEGRIDAHDYEGASGSAVPNHGLPRFRHCAFDAAYPLGQVRLSDEHVPLDVKLQAFNPLIPADADRSSIPVAVLRFVLTNKTDAAIRATVCGNIENFIGSDGTNGKPVKNENRFISESGRRATHVKGILMRTAGIDRCAEQWGTMALSTTAAGRISHRTAWADLSWGDSLLDFWDDLIKDGKLDNRESIGIDNPQASLAVGLSIPGRSTREVTFLISWHFPNRQTWMPDKKYDALSCIDGRCGSNPNWTGNYYTTRYLDAWDVAVKTAQHLDDLEADTLSFVRSFCESSLPKVVKEAALFNLSTLRTQTTFRTSDGHLYGWEGCADKSGCCFGSCTHVWNYEQATAFLFGELSKTMRDVEFTDAMRANGMMLFRAPLPFGHETEWIGAAADGQMGCIMKLYRDWQLSGDDAMLQRLWPQARKALEFCWIPGGWDADRDGVMEGCQHNTMDVEYYGPNPQMGGWYLGALASAVEMARHVGEVDFADTCQRLFNTGSKWMDEHLFNGEYYEQEIRPPLNPQAVAKGLQVGMGAKDLSNPDLQLGAGCLVDQLVGQFVAHICNLGYLLDRSHVQSTLRSIMKYNYKNDFSAHFNHMRSFVLNDESGLVMASYPLGRRPDRPFPYYNEVMTGFEHVAAIHMLYEGQITNGIKAIKSIRARYDGLKRNPFDEAECGHHYARAMASWAAVNALTGFHYSAVSQAIAFAPADGSHFWSTGYAWGACELIHMRDSIRVNLAVLGGELRFKRFNLSRYGQYIPESAVTLSVGGSIRFKVSKNKK